MIMSAAKKIALGIVIVLLVLSALVHYSYQRLEIGLSSASFNSPPVTISEERLLLSALTFAVTGKILSFIDAVDTINLKLGLTLRNGGFLPVVIPPFEYDLYLNDVYVGKGRSPQQLTLSPGQVSEIEVSQSVSVDAIRGAIPSIIQSGGVMNIKLKGTAKPQFFIPISVPFTVERSVNLVKVMEEYLGGINTEPNVQVRWLMNDLPTYSATQDMSITASVYFGFDLTYSGPLTIKVMRDVAFGFDETVVSNRYDVTIGGKQTQNFNLSFITEPPSSTRGYYVKIEYEGGEWTMANSYPPRLKVTTPELKVTDAYWTVDGVKVTQARVGDKVEFHVLLRVDGGPFKGVITVKVMKDIAFGPDKVLGKASFNVNMWDGGKAHLSATFTPNEASEGSLRGYYLEVYAEGKKIWGMEGSYPPRLTVTSS
jgi:hypothetical protein